MDQKSDTYLQPESLPPAYKPPPSIVLKISKQISLTVIALTIVIGTFIMVSIYITRGSDCNCGTKVQKDPNVAKNELSQGFDLHTSESRSAPSVKKNVPLQLTFPNNLDATIGRMMNKKNKKAHMNCFMEKKSSSEVVNHKSKVMHTPFGNLTTDPRKVHLTGQTMTVTCHTGTKDMGFHQKKHPVPLINESMRRGRMHRFPVLTRGRRSLDESMCQCACNC